MPVAVLLTLSVLATFNGIREIAFARPSISSLFVPQIEANPWPMRQRKKAGKLSKSYDLRHGVRQGDRLSAILFIIYMDLLTKAVAAGRSLLKGLDTTEFLL